MATLLKSETFTAATYTSGRYYNYKVDIILNSQASASNKSNITIKTYQNRGNSGYSGNSFIKFRLLGHTSKEPTDTEWVAPVKVSSNITASPPNWEEIEDLRHTADFTHKSDGTLAIRVIVELDNTGSTNQYAPKDTKMECVTTVPDFAPGKTWAVLDPPADWTTSNAGSENGFTPMSFTFTPVAGVDHYNLRVTAGQTTTLVGALQGNNYTSGKVCEISNTAQLNAMDEMGAAGEAELPATVILHSYDSSNTLIGSDEQYFKVKGSGIDVKVGNGWRNGLAWVYVEAEGIWKPGIVWVKVNGTWKKGIGLSDE